MITQRELNTGNWICHSANHLFQIGSIDRNFVMQLTGDDRWLVISGLAGVPLTEEILLKCGFMVDDDMGLNRSDNKRKIYRDKNITLGIDEDDSIKRWQEVDDYWYSCFSGEPIRFVHELQNIYYWLSGKKELEINL